MLVASEKELLVCELLAIAAGALCLLFVVANLGYILLNLRGRRTSLLPPIDVLLAAVAAFSWHRIHPETRWPVWAAILVALFELPMLVGIIAAIARHLAWSWRMPQVFKRRGPDLRRLGDHNAPLEGRLATVEGHEFVLVAGEAQHRFPIVGARERYVIGRAAYLRFTSNRDEPTHRELTEVRIARR